MPDPEMESIVYVSSAVELLSIEEIGRLLQKARERNSEYDVTGVLLYIDGNFMQYIEGPRDNLDFIYQIVKKDPKHSGIIQVSHETIEQRQFSDWSMAFQTRDFEGYLGSPKERKLIDMLLETPAENPSPARIVLQGFWERTGS